MCGIFAAFNINGDGPSDTALMGAVHAVSHRGPDNLGHFRDAHCFLGHTRLSIIGIDASGNQPFHHGDLAMVFNGEIFNYIELREELAGLGHAFATQSDTEVVIKAWRQWGGDCFARFNGMWSIAIYDREARTLVVSRDRFGQKPLFVMREGTTFYAASEFQQLAPLSDGRVNHDLIRMFLKEGTYEGEGQTFLRSIEEFPKAHWCRISADGKMESFRYWAYPSGPVKRTGPEDFKEFSSLLQDAVRLRLRADVPFGLLLSGGVDSTIIAAFARKAAGPGVGIPAFTYSSGDAYDERVYAQKVAERLGLPLTVREQEARPEDYRGRLCTLVRHMGRGHSSPAIVSIDYLYESVAASGIKVALDGQGSDELLAGYKNYFMLVIPWFLARGKVMQAVRCLRDQFRFGFLLAVILYLRNVLPPSFRKLLRTVYGYERFFRGTPAADRKRIVPDSGATAPNGNALNRYLIRQHSLGLENLLYYGDIVAMRSAVENRSPFMDHRLVDFVFSRDEKLKLHDAVDKYALRTLPEYEAFRDVLDRDKIGFTSDIRPETKAAMIAELKGSPILRWPIFTPRLRAFLDSGGMATAKYERFLFRLYQVHLWEGLFNHARAAGGAEAAGVPAAAAARPAQAPQPR